jgi:hypothetical protein
MTEATEEPREAPRAPTHRVRTIVRLGCAGVVVATIGLAVAGAVLARRGAAALGSQRARILAAGDALAGDAPTAAVSTETLPRGKNAALVYRHAFAALAAADDGAVSGADPLGPMAQADLVADLVQDSAAGFALLRKALEVPACRFVEPGSKEGVPVRGFERAVKLLLLGARLDADSGFADEALAALVLVDRVPRALSSEPSLAAHGLRTRLEGRGYALLERVLDRGEPTEAGCRALLDALEEGAAREDLIRALLAERTRGVACFRAFRGEGPSPDEDAALRAVDPDAYVAHRALARACPWVVDRDEAAYLDLLSGGLEAARRPRSDTAAVLEEARRLDVARREPQPFLTRAWAPEVGRAIEQHLEGEARRAVARVALALRIHRLRRGTYPATLEALDAGILASGLRDPVSGQLLRYERKGDGFALWSVGLDGRDDAGKRAGVRGEPEGSAADDLGLEVSR